MRYAFIGKYKFFKSEGVHQVLPEATLCSNKSTIIYRYIYPPFFSLLLGKHSMGKGGADRDKI